MAERTLPEIARILGAGTVIEGDVQHSGGRLRLNVHLVDALRSNDAFIWITALAELEKKYGKRFGRNPAAWTEFFKKRPIRDER